MNHWTTGPPLNNPTVNFLCGGTFQGRGITRRFVTGSAMGERPPFPPETGTQKGQDHDNNRTVHNTFVKYYARNTFVKKKTNNSGLSLFLEICNL